MLGDCPGLGFRNFVFPSMSPFPGGLRQVGCVAGLWVSVSQRMRVCLNLGRLSTQSLTHFLIDFHSSVTFTKKLHTSTHSQMTCHVMPLNEWTCCLSISPSEIWVDSSWGESERCCSDCSGSSTEFIGLSSIELQAETCWAQAECLFG